MNVYVNVFILVCVVKKTYAVVYNLSFLHTEAASVVITLDVKVGNY